MKRHFVLKGRPGKLSHLQYIVKKLDEVIRVPSDIVFL
jgi:hypothetical protein